MIAVIMAGGSGTRFWPMSREAYPKQFLKLFNNKSMIRLTYERLLNFVNKDNIFIVTTQSQVPLIMEHIPELLITQIIIEPYGMNTAPCIALSAIYLNKLFNKDEIMYVLPADHYIPDEEHFSATMKKAIDVANNNNLVTFGIIPSYPATGYGYIEADKENYDLDAFHVKQFKEKPDLQTAINFIESGNFYWNSGMFCWKISAIIESFKNLAPEILDKCKCVLNEIEFDNQREIYKSVQKNPIDIAIMEKSNNVKVIPVSFTWSDVGNWFSLSELMKKSDHNNYPEDTISIDSFNNSVFSNKQVALIGVNDLIISETDDAILVCSKDKTEEVKNIVNQLKESNSTELL